MKIVALCRSFGVVPLKVPTIKMMFNSQRMCQCLQLVQTTKNLKHTGAKRLPGILVLPYERITQGQRLKNFTVLERTKSQRSGLLSKHRKAWVENF